MVFSAVMIREDGGSESKERKSREDGNLRETEDSTRDIEIDIEEDKEIDISENQKKKDE
jgi:hypothetical protein